MSPSKSLPRLTLSALLALPLLGAFADASATVLQDRYRGQPPSVPVTPPAVSITPNYNNNSQTAGLDNLLALASGYFDPASALSSERFHQPSGQANPPLCGSDGQAACIAQYKGLLGYAVLKFPATGPYQFYGYVDDHMALSISSVNSTVNNAPTNHRWVEMYKEVGRLQGSPVDQYTALGSVFQAQANACLMVRVAWNNTWGDARVGLGWWTPGAASPPQGHFLNNDGPLIPAAQLLDPTSEASFAGCTFPITAQDKTDTTPVGTPLTLTHDITTGWGAAVDYDSLRLLTLGEAETNGVNGFVTQNGTVTCNATGCTYTPNAGFIGEDRFTYQVCTAAAVAPASTPVCDTATFTVTVTPAAAPGAGIAAVPTLGTWMLSALAVLLGGLGMVRRRSRH